MRKDPLACLQQLALKYGDIVCLKFGRRHDYLVNHPDHIRAILCAPQSEMARSTPPGLKRLLGRGLLTSQGSYHQRHKRMLAPAFHRSIIRQWNGAIAGACRQMCDRWSQGDELDIEAEMLRLTLAIILEALFSAKLEEDTDRIAKAAGTIIRWIHCRTLPVIHDLLDKVAVGRIHRFKEASARFDAIIYRMIRERRAENIPANDLLSALLAVCDEETGNASLTDEEVRDETLTILMAGHETTAHALTWTWYLLSRHPEIEQKLQTELRTVLEGRAPKIENLDALPYNRKIFTEAMRLFPPVWIVARRNPKSWSLAGYTFPPGSFIFASQYLMHRDARYFPDPERFEPERWTPEAIAKRPRYSYFPFGGGSRQCIGDGIAWTVGLLALATIAQRWRLKLASNQLVAIEPLITLRPKYGMRMITHQQTESIL
jgi:cytochrome P450